MFVDAHVHLHRFERPPEVLSAADAAGVVCVAVTETPKDYEVLAARIGRRPTVRVALGAHPLRAHSLGAWAMRRFVASLVRVEYVGEVGLDGSREGRPTLPVQRRVFDQVLGAPGIQRKVLTVHSRGAEAETIACLSDAGACAILHWYSGALKHADRAVEAGMYFSINAAMLRSQKGVRLLQALPRDRVVTETDGPYVRVGGRSVAPATIPQLVSDLAGVWQCEPDEAREQVWANMASVFSRRTATEPSDRTIDGRLPISSGRVALA